MINCSTNMLDCQEFVGEPKVSTEINVEFFEELQLKLIPSSPKRYGIAEICGTEKTFLEKPGLVEFDNYERAFMLDVSPVIYPGGVRSKDVPVEYAVAYVFDIDNSEFDNPDDYVTADSVKRELDQLAVK